MIALNSQRLIAWEYTDLYSKADLQVVLTLSEMTTALFITGMPPGARQNSSILNFESSADKVFGKKTKQSDR